MGVEQKSNEITATPELLELIEVSGCLVATDALGFQTEIARTIVEAGSDDCLKALGTAVSFTQRDDKERTAVGYCIVGRFLAAGRLAATGGSRTADVGDST